MSFQYRTRLSDPCAVCAKVTGRETDWPVVASTTHAVALVPSRQQHLGTTLVVPRRHVFDPADLADDEATELYLMVRLMVDATMSSAQANYYHISQYVGAPGGEPIDHLHWRVEPRSQTPARKWSSIADVPATPQAELATIAARYRGFVAADPARSAMTAV
ncbi:hypothetical protein GCM10009661_62160 [Catellatospora chokoriensis]|uniref:HIT domain-containing protein n=1 Tax=Catellatospora chokoriensis TaxID=310353 RepID=A0A8J3JSL1_9ACTN|nr:hypothetical protein Cch02nite_37610 [Catellatospora chokoriensis]